MKPSRTFPLKLIAACSLIALLRGPCFGQQPADPQANLLKNGSFENGMEGWETNSIGKQALVTRDTSVTHDGHPSIRIDQPGAADTFLQQEVTFKAQTHYRLSGWIKAKNVVKAKINGAQEGAVGAMLCVMGGYRLSEFVNNTDEWKYVSLDIFYPSFKDPVKDPHKKVGAQLGFYKKWVTGTAWFADISLVELGPNNTVVSPK